MKAKKRVVVVGAGIIGASIAWHLAKAGADVTVLEAAQAGGVATAASFAWLNASWGNPEPYFHLRQRSLREWTRLAGEVPGLPLAWTGGLCLDMADAEREAYRKLHAAWGYDIRPIGRDEAARLEPNVRNLPEEALFAAEEGMAEPVAAARSLLADAQRHGARLVTNDPVVAFARSGDRLTGAVTASATWDADEIVLAAGIATGRLAALAGVEFVLDTPPGLIVHSRPHARILNGIVLAPGLHMRQTAGGRVIAGADFGGGDPGADEGTTAAALFETLKAALRGGEALQLDFHTVGRRPTPKDGFPAVGRAVNGLYLAVTHSGMTLAPALGLFAAEEIVRDRRDPLLAPYAPSRFAGSA